MSQKRFQQITKQQPQAQPDWIRKITEYCAKEGIEPEELIYFHKFNRFNSQQPKPKFAPSQYLTSQHSLIPEDIIQQLNLPRDGDMPVVLEPLQEVIDNEAAKHHEQLIIDRPLYDGIKIESPFKEEQPEEEYDDSNLDVTEFKTEAEKERDGDESTDYLKSIRNHQRPKLVKGVDDL